MQEAEERRKKLEAELKADSSNKVEFTPVTITFIDLEYYVPNPSKGTSEDLQLLRGVTGSVRPGAELDCLQFFNRVLCICAITVGNVAGLAACTCKQALCSPCSCALLAVS